MRTDATTADSPRDPLLGRGRELEELTGALHDALAGHGRLVMLGGEAGIGKTRLAEEAGARAIAKGAQGFLGAMLGRGRRSRVLALDSGATRKSALGISRQPKRGCGTAL
jgi:MoxR-like ATPase